MGALLGVYVWRDGPLKDQSSDNPYGLSQATLVAGLVQAPSAYDPLRYLSAGQQRQRHVLDRLVAIHVLSAAQADAAYAAPLGLR